MNVLGQGNLFAAIDEAIQATGQSDAYFRGMCNGMLYVKSLLDGKKPQYFPDPSEESDDSDDIFLEEDPAKFPA